MPIKPSKPGISPKSMYEIIKAKTAPKERTGIDIDKSEFLNAFINSIVPTTLNDPLIMSARKKSSPKEGTSSNNNNVKSTKRLKNRKDHETRYSSLSLNALLLKASLADSDKALKKENKNPSMKIDNTG